MPDPKILIKFEHGLGDNVQLATALPQLPFDCKVLTTWDKAWLYGNKALVRDYHDIVGYEGSDAPWPEPTETDYSCSKIDLFLHHYGVEAEKRAYPKFKGEKHTTNVALIHYQGRSSGKKKNISPFTMHAMLPILRELGYEPIIIDFDYRSTLGVAKIQDREFMESSRLWSLINDAALFVGIDSGPGHLAACTNTPSIIVWSGHHPLNYYCPLADNVLHLLPVGAKITPDVMEYYRCAVYQTLELDLWNILMMDGLLPWAHSFSKL